MILTDYGYISDNNPIRMYAVGSNKSYANDAHADFEHNKGFYQPYQWGDFIRLQVNLNLTYCNVADMTITLNNCSGGGIVDLFDVDNIWINPEGYLNVTVSLLCPEITGYFFVKLYSPGIGVSDLMMYSEPLWIKETHTNTVMLSYNDTGIINNMYFMAGQYFYHRIFGGFKLNETMPASDTEIFTNQSRVPDVLYSLAYNVKTLTVGNNSGVANYEIDIVNRIFQFQNVNIDGVGHSRTDGTIEQSTDLNNALSIWKIKVQENVNSINQLLLASADQAPEDPGLDKVLADGDGSDSITISEFSSNVFLAIAVDGTYGGSKLSHINENDTIISDSDDFNDSQEYEINLISLE